MPNNLNVYFCHHCESFVKYFKELWHKGLDEPYKIELFQYECETPTKIEEIKLQEKPGRFAYIKHIMDFIIKRKGIISSYAYCGNCKQPLGEPFDIDFLKRRKKLILKNQKTDKGLK